MRTNKRIAVFASGRGSNFVAIMRAVKQGVLKAEVALLVCDNPDAPVIDKAKRFGVKVALVQRKEFADALSFEREILKRLKKEKIVLLVLAGFMRILGPRLVRAYTHRILNIHPALLPSFKGAHAITDAFRYGVKVTGVTVHFVDEKMDHGPIILQEPLAVTGSDTLGSLEAKIHKIEHRLYPAAIGLVLGGRLRLQGRKVAATGR